MSQKELHEIRKRLEEAERRREEAERRQEEAERRREEEQRRRVEAEQTLHVERLQTQNTTLPEFLDACHEHLFLGLTIQKDKKSSTKGDPANADRKLRPSRIQEWKHFPDEQMAIWANLMDADFVAERHFTPLLALKEYGKEVRDRMLSSELDLGYFQRHSVESRVTSVIKQLHANPQLQRRFHLNGDVTFENHANTLTDDSRIVTDMNSLSLDQEGLRRSARLARQSRDTSRSTSRDMELDRIVRYQKDESPEHICRRVVAAVITQLFHYMYEGGNEYGCVAMGEAFIFLRVPDNDPSTVLFYLSVPQEDVGNTTKWPRDDNRLHLTAVGQLLAFTLCPNVAEHGVDRHRLNTKLLIKLLDQQLSSDPDPHSELGCESLHIHGTRGALFKITLWSHGYTFVGKGVPIDFIQCAKREETMYSHLRAIQGQFVPVVFGGLNLRRPFSYDGIAEMVHLTLMSYAGRNLTRHEMDQTMLIAQAETSLRAVHNLGVLHSDPIPGNMVWNEENQRVMFIDFERAQYQRRTPLGPIAANQKRKRVTTVWDKSPNKRSDSFQRELSRMRSELRY
uniref:Putative cell division control protein 7 like 2 n=1 Tax=Talaromyces marneffei PM1 TaxID=1077442 RepID=A0A093ULW5_TALMA